VLTVAIANFHSPTAPLPLGSQFEVEGYKFGHLKGVLTGMMRELAPGKAATAVATPTAVADLAIQ